MRTPQHLAFTGQVQQIFKFFDEDGGGTITYDEFLFGIRGEMNERREQMVLLAFDVLDKDKSGVVDVDDIVGMYNVEGNLEVLSGKKTKNQVLREFLDTFDCGEKDGKVTPSEFKRYYANISASVDLDDYFELMIRNAWHIPGGEGWCANTANKRVLVTDPETGEERIECVENDLGMDSSDPAAIQARLAQNKTKGLAGGVVSLKPYKNEGGKNKNARFESSFTMGPGPAKPAAVAPKPANNMRFKSAFQLAPAVADLSLEDEEEVGGGWSKSNVPQSTKGLLKRLKINFKRRGADGINGLARRFRIVDGDGEFFCRSTNLARVRCVLASDKISSLTHTQNTRAPFLARVRRFGACRVPEVHQGM